MCASFSVTVEGWARDTLIFVACLCCKLEVPSQFCGGKFEGRAELSYSDDDDLWVENAQCDSRCKSNMWRLCLNCFPSQFENKCNRSPRSIIYSHLFPKCVLVLLGGNAFDRQAGGAWQMPSFEIARKWMCESHLGVFQDSGKWNTESHWDNV